MSNKLTSNELQAFQTITEFINNLADIYGHENHQYSKQLQYYQRLITKTRIDDKDIIRKHIASFRDFCSSNRDNFDTLNFNPDRVKFSERIELNVGFFLAKADEETRNVIVEYLLTISALVDPVGKAKDMLSQLQLVNRDQPNELPNLDNMFEQMGPMMNQMLSNPMIGNMLSSMTGGAPIPDLNNVDMKALSGSMNKVMKAVTETLENSDDPEIKNLLNMVKPSTK